MVKYIVVGHYIRCFWCGDCSGGIRSEYQNSEYTKHGAAVAAFKGLEIGAGRYFNGAPVLAGASLYRLPAGDWNKAVLMDIKGEMYA